jgi:hypothetical protein
MHRRVSRLLGLGAVLLAGCAVYLYFRPQTEGPAFHVQDAERDLGAVALGTLELRFPITNDSAEPRRILGRATEG